MSGRNERAGYSFLVDEEQSFEKKIEERRAKGLLYISEVKEIIALLKKLELFKKYIYVFEDLIITEEYRKIMGSRCGRGIVRVLKRRRMFQSEVMFHFDESSNVFAFIPGEWISKLSPLKQNLEILCEQKIERKEMIKREKEMKEKRERKEDLAKAFGIDLNG